MGRTSAAASLGALIEPPPQVLMNWGSNSKLADNSKYTPAPALRHLRNTPTPLLPSAASVRKEFPLNVEIDFFNRNLPSMHGVDLIKHNAERIKALKRWEDPKPDPFVSFIHNYIILKEEAIAEEVRLTKSWPITIKLKHFLSSIFANLPPVYTWSDSFKIFGRTVTLPFHFPAIDRNVFAGIMNRVLGFFEGAFGLAYAGLNDLVRNQNQAVRFIVKFFTQPLALISNTFSYARGFLDGALTISVSFAFFLKDLFFAIWSESARQNLQNFAGKVLVSLEAMIANAFKLLPVALAIFSYIVGFGPLGQILGQKLGAFGTFLGDVIVGFGKGLGAGLKLFLASNFNIGMGVLLAPVWSGILNLWAGAIQFAGTRLDHAIRHPIDAAQDLGNFLANIPTMIASCFCCSAKSKQEQAPAHHAAPPPPDGGAPSSAATGGTPRQRDMEGGTPYSLDENTRLHGALGAMKFDGSSLSSHSRQSSASTPRGAGVAPTTPRSGSAVTPASPRTAPVVPPPDSNRSRAPSRMSLGGT